MLTAITGIYTNGQVILETLPKVIKQAKVLVIFEEETVGIPTVGITVPPQKKALKKRTFGISKGMIEISSDFDEPLDDLKEYM
jgi:Protein of unknown function (DUF2281)